MSNRPLETPEFWKEQNRRINADLGRVEAERTRLQADLEAVTENRDLMQEERDAWRNAFSRYKAHDYECDRIRLDGNEDPSRPCTCGLAEILKDLDG